jgi:hypothetical protein
MASRLPSEEPEAETSGFQVQQLLRLARAIGAHAVNVGVWLGRGERKMRFQPSAVHTGTTQAQQSTSPVTLLESYSTCARPRLRIHCGAQHALRTLFDTYLKVGIILALGRRMLMQIYMSRSQRL